jgi:hypothetical protein
MVKQQPATFALFLPTGKGLAEFQNSASPLVLP